MACYVDGLVRSVAQGAQARRIGARNGHRWCHMLADSPDELHHMAEKIGLHPAFFQLSRTGVPHYDLTLTRRRAAVVHGAIEVDRAGLVEVIRRYREIG